MTARSQVRWCKIAGLFSAAILILLIFWGRAPNWAFLIVASGILISMIWFSLLALCGPKGATSLKHAKAFGLVVVLAPLALAMVAMSRFNAINAGAFYALPCLVGLPISALLQRELGAKVSRLRFAVQAIIISCLSPGLLVWSGLALANSLSIHEPVVVHRAEVTALTIRRSKGFTSRWLGLDHPIRDNAGFHVSRAVYERLLVGEPVCIAEYRGLLSMVWFSVDACPE